MEPASLEIWVENRSSSGHSGSQSTFVPKCGPFSRCASPIGEQGARTKKDAKKHGRRLTVQVGIAGPSRRWRTKSGAVRFIPWRTGGLRVQGRFLLEPESGRQEDGNNTRDRALSSAQQVSGVLSIRVPQKCMRQRPPHTKYPLCCSSGADRPLSGATAEGE
ncbi:hypothetical protein VTI28DRAFT_163 [Corynascus sepedonium]